MPMKRQTHSEISIKRYHQQAAGACGPQHQHALASTTDGSVFPAVQLGRRQLTQMNRLEDLTPAPSMTLPIAHSSRPTLGFPFGTALLLIVIFSLSGIFSCCYHWDRLRPLLRSRHPVILQEGRHAIISIGSSPGKATSDHKSEKVGKECGLSVIMPGDKIPKFFARPCPHEMCLVEADKNEVEVQVKCPVS